MAYDKGTLALIASKRPDLLETRTGEIDIFPTFETAAEARAQLNVTRLTIQAFDRDVMPSGVPEQFKREWSAFRDTYEAFYNDSMNSWVALNLGSKTTSARAKQFAADTEEWRKRFVSLGGTSTAPPPTTPPVTPGLPEVASRAEGIAKAVALVAVVGGVVYIASMVKR